MEHQRTPEQLYSRVRVAEGQAVHGHVGQGLAVTFRPLRRLQGPSQDWGCAGQLGIFAFVLWSRVDAWLGF